MVWRTNLGLRTNRGRGFFRLLRHRIGNHRFPVAPFLQATAHDPDLSFLFHDERSATLWAGLSKRHIRGREVAVRISRATVENAWTSAPAFACAAAPHEFPFIAFRAFDAHGDRSRV